MAHEQLPSTTFNRIPIESPSSPRKKTMSHNFPADAWSQHSSRWKSQIQQVSKLPCKEVVSKILALVPATPTSKFLDNGAGSGMLTSTILDHVPGAQVTAADLSPGMIDTLNATSRERNWDTVTTLVADACDLRSAGLKDDTFTHSAGSAFLPFVPDPTQALAEMKRVTQPGGALGVTTWMQPSWHGLWEAAVRASVDPQYTLPPLSDHFHPDTSDVERMRGLMLAAGLERVEVWVVETPHAPTESPAAAVDTFFTMGNPVSKALQKGYEGRVEEIRPAFEKVYAEKYDGVKKSQHERAIVAVGVKPL
jgi:ubiquinone/menaquinone biosynthesis C-methylase UbiE